MRIKLTDAYLRTLKLPERERYEIVDALCPPLLVRVAPRGLVFCTMPRINKRQVRYTIGRYPIRSLMEARQTALQIAREAAAGIDSRVPVPNSAVAVVLTFEAAVAEYRDRYLKANARSWKDIEANLLHPKLRSLRKRELKTISKRDIIDAVDRMMGDGKPQAAVNMLRRLKMFMNWAVERDMIPFNPAAGTRPPAKTVERDRVLTRAELKAIWLATFQLPMPYGQMYRIMILTGQRRSEVATMQWSHICDQIWTLPAERVKRARSHAVPLAPLAMQTLATLPRFVDGDFVFSTSAGKRPSSNFSKMKAELDRLSGVCHWRIHDMRRTMRSGLAEIGVSREVARKLFNHHVGKIDRIYNRYEFMAEKKESLEKWESHLLELF